MAKVAGQVDHHNVGVGSHQFEGDVQAFIGRAVVHQDKLIVIADETYCCGRAALMEFSDTTPFAAPFSAVDNPRLEFVMEVRLTFPEVYTLANVPSGGNRSAVLVSGGTFEGPHLKGRAVPGSGGDYAYFRPDDVAVFDARYLLEEDDGTLILLNNRGYLWGRRPDTMQRLRDWAIEVLALQPGAAVDRSSRSREAVHA